MKQQIQSLINDGLIRKQICDQLHINRKELDAVAKELGLLENLQKNATAYTNQNFILRNKKVKDEKIKSLKEKYDFNFIQDLIVNKKLSLKEIELNHGIQYNDIGYIANVLNINDQLKVNNKKNRGNNIKNGYKRIHDERLNKLNLLYKDKIKELLYEDDECTSTKIYRTINDPDLHHFIIKIIKLNGLEKRWKENFERQRYNDRIRNAKKGGDKLKGTTFIRRDVTDEMISYYQTLKNDDLFDGKARTLFHKKFKTSSDHIWSTLQEKIGILKKHPAGFLPGKLNKMYGKSPSNNAGCGINGHVIINGEKIFFRSLLELKIFLYLDINNIIFTMSKHRVKYNYNDKIYTYCPDIVIKDTIYEIKPEGLEQLPINKLKFNALIEYCKTNHLKCAYIGYNTYDLTNINKDMILNYVNLKKIKINDKQYNRLLKNL